MFHRCFSCVLLVLPFLVLADPIPSKSDETLGQLTEHETLHMFKDFASTFGRKYKSPLEYKRRLAIFSDNLKIIDRLNREEQGTARFGVTRFADLTYDEFKKNFTGGNIPEEEWERHEAALEDEPEVEIEFMDDGLQEGLEIDSVNKKEVYDEDEIKCSHHKCYLPKKYDYRKKKAVTRVKDQGGCQSCWAFSAIANIEGVWAKKKKKLFDLSEQELVDCDKVDGGCDHGGWMQAAVKELVRLGGVAKAEDYPYVNKLQTCKFTQDMAVVKVAGTKSIPQNEKKIARALVRNGPLSVALDASFAFQFYVSGVFDPTSSMCSSDKKYVNHGVTFVGYGEDVKSDGTKLPFWIIKNSWGTVWGEKGYMKIVRGKNACAVNSYVSTAYL